MSPESQLFLTGLLLSTAVVAGFGATLIRRRLGRTSLQMRSAAAALDAGVDNLPKAFASFRAQLAERSAVGEHAVWSLSRLDDRIDRAGADLRGHSTELNRLRGRLEASRTAIDRFRAVLPAIIRAIELRRAILG